MSELSNESGQPIPVSYGNTYYFVIDGYSPGDEGDYCLNIGGNLVLVTSTEETSFSSVMSLYR
jgi:predicted RNA-binding protein with TRAM domain